MMPQSQPFLSMTGAPLTSLSLRIWRASSLVASGSTQTTLGVKASLTRYMVRVAVRSWRLWLVIGKRGQYARTRMRREKLAYGITLGEELSVAGRIGTTGLRRLRWSGDDAPHTYVAAGR